MDSWNGLLPMECIALDQTSCITVGKHTLYNLICLFWWNWRKYFWLHSALSSSGQIALLIAKETANKRTDNLQLLNEQLWAAASESDSGTEVIYWDYRKTDTSCLVAKVSAKCCQMVKKSPCLLERNQLWFYTPFASLWLTMSQSDVTAEEKVCIYSWTTG